jgi:hypothetical protein
MPTELRGRRYRRSDHAHPDHQRDAGTPDAGLGPMETLNRLLIVNRERLRFAWLLLLILLAACNNPDGGGDGGGGY